MQQQQYEALSISLLLLVPLNNTKTSASEFNEQHITVHNKFKFFLICFFLFFVLNMNECPKNDNRKNRL